MTNERLLRGDDEHHRRDADEAIERRALAIFERRRCSWAEAWTRAVAEPRRRGRAGRVTLSEQIGVERRAHRAAIAPGRTTAQRGLVAPVMRSAEPAAAAGGHEIDHRAAELVARARHGGAALDAELRPLLERALGIGLDSVRVHTGSDADAAARALGARAFAVGEDVFFRDGAYAPRQPDGQRLIAHEVAHTVQARRGGGGDAPATLSQPEDAPEREADAFAEGFVRDLGAHGRGVAAAKTTGTFASGAPDRAPTTQQRERIRPAAGRIFLERDDHAPGGSRPAPPQARAPHAEGPPAPAAEGSPSAAHATSGPVAAHGAAHAPETPTAGGPTHTSPEGEHATGGAHVNGGESSHGGGAEAPVPAGAATAVGPDVHRGDHPVAGNDGSDAAPAGKTVVPSTTGAGGAPALAASLAASAGPAVPDGPGFEGTRAVLAQLDAAAATARAQLLQQLEHGIGEIAAAILAQTSAIAAAGAAHKKQIQLVFVQAKADVARAVTEAGVAIDADAAAKKAALATWHTDAIATNAATFEDAKKRAHKAGTDGGKKAMDAANHSASSVGEKMQDSADKALAVGQQKATAARGKPESKSAKAKAANKIASDAAAKIKNGRDKLVGKLRGMAPSVAEQLRKKGEEASATIATGAPQVRTHYAKIRTTTDSAITQLAAKSRQGLTGTKTKILGSLDALEQKTLAAVDQHSTRSSADLQTAGREATTAYQKQGAAALQANDAAVAALKSQIAPRRIDPIHAGSASALATTALSQALQQITAQARAPVEHVKGHVTDAGQQTTTALAQTADRVATQVHGAVSKVRSETTKASADVGAKLKDALAGAQTAGTAADKQVKTGIDAQIGAVDKAVIKGVADLQIGLDAKVTEGEDKAREPLAQVGPKVDEAHAKIDRDADKGVVGKALSWVGDQLSYLGKMLLDPGFWVGLLVVIVVVALLPEELAGLALLAAMAGIGALAAGIGTIVSNLAHGRPWHQNLLQNVIVGAVFGAALTGVAILLGTGLVGIAGMMVAAGVLTVVVNLIEGKPWDEGLLANVLLVGVFAGIAKYFGKPAGLDVDPSLPRPGDPAVPKPGDPAVPKPGEPNPPKPGEPDPPKPGEPNPPKPDEPNPPKPDEPNPPKPDEPNPPKPDEPNPPEPKPSKEAELRAEAAEKQKTFAKGEAKKESDKFDFSRDPDAAAEIEKAYRDAFSDEYVAQRTANKDPKAAQTSAKKAAKAKANQVAEARAGTPLNVETAQLRAHADVESGKAFKSNDKLGTDTADAKKNYEAGTQGQAAKTLSPKLAGKTVPEMEQLLEADAAAGKSTRLPDTVTAGKPQHSWQYPDGTLVRVKPRGDAFGEDPTYSVEVNKQKGGPSANQDDVAFKVGADGKAVPKGPGDIDNPYPKDINPPQHTAYEQQVIAEGHLKAKPEPPPPPPPPP